MDETAFLHSIPPATDAKRTPGLVISLADGNKTKINGLQLDMVGEACPLLAIAFETHESGLVHHFEDFSRDAVISFLRWTYTLDLVPPTSPIGEVSVKTMLELIQLGTNYDSTLMTECAITTLRNVIKDCKRACQVPVELVAGLQYLHDTLDCCEPAYGILVGYSASQVTKRGLINKRSFLDVLRARPRLHCDIAETCAAYNEKAAARTLVMLNRNSYEIEATSKQSRDHANLIKQAKWPELPPDTQDARVNRYDWRFGPSGIDKAVEDFGADDPVEVDEMIDMNDDNDDDGEDGESGAYRFPPHKRARISGARDEMIPPWRLKGPPTGPWEGNVKSLLAAGLRALPRTPTATPSTDFPDESEQEASQAAAKGKEGQVEAPATKELPIRAGKVDAAEAVELAGERTPTTASSPEWVNIATPVSSNASDLGSVGDRPLDLTDDDDFVLIGGAY